MRPVTHAELMLAGALLVSCAACGDGSVDGAGGASAATSGPSTTGPSSSPAATSSSTGGSQVGLLRVPEGTFLMGPSDENDEAFEVTQTRDVLLGIWEVTQGEWLELFGGDPSSEVGCGPSCPVQNVTWFAAIAYVNALSARDGYLPCFVLSGCSGSAFGGDLDCSAVDVATASANPLDCAGYRLPTEAEWEHAYRADAESDFYSGALTEAGCTPVDPALDAIGWYCGNAPGGPRPVGQKAPNPLGFYDLSGNVWEYVWDGFAPYPDGARTDPTGAADSERRVVRGGSYLDEAERCRGRGRSGLEPSARSATIGLRVARTAP